MKSGTKAAQHIDFHYVLLTITKIQDHSRYQLQMNGK